MARLPVIICMLAAVVFTPTVKAAVFTVGDSAGWDVSADLSSWVANRIFYVGDTLLFQYSKYHSVNEVDRAGYDSCNVTNPLLTSSKGNTSVLLASPGERYFVCGVSLHCRGGMKLHVSVERNESAASAGAPLPHAHPEVPSPTSASDFPFMGSGSYGVERGFTTVAWLCAYSVMVWAFG